MSTTPLLGLILLASLTKEQLNFLKEIRAGNENVTRGVYNYTDPLTGKSYAGSFGTGKGTSQLSNRLADSIRTDKLNIDNINPENVSITDMSDRNRFTDQDVWKEEANQIKKNGGISKSSDSDVLNQRRRPNTGDTALADDHPKKGKC